MLSDLGITLDGPIQHYPLPNDTDDLSLGNSFDNRFGPIQCYPLPNDTDDLSLGNSFDNRFGPIQHYPLRSDTDDPSLYDNIFVPRFAHPMLSLSKRY